MKNWDKRAWRKVGIIVVCAALFVSVLSTGGEVSSTQEAATVMVSSSGSEAISETPTRDSEEIASATESAGETYEVLRVVDGDTLDVSIDGRTERIRLIGINTPETADPRKPVECFGVEASNKAKELLSGKRVVLKADGTQGERDKYNRLLRYVFLEDGTHFNLRMVQEGYAYEYTYELPYAYQAEFRSAERHASENKRGLWGETCEYTSTRSTSATPVPATAPVSDGAVCTVKGNISSSGDKIFHVIGCGSYNKTVIDEDKGERWFCSEKEALDAGWRKALNCN